MPQHENSTIGYPDGRSSAAFEYSYKCGACANKFAARMTKRNAGKLFCPTCGEEIIAFPTDAEIAHYDYIAHTRHDRFHSIVVQEDDSD